MKNVLIIQSDMILKQSTLDNFHQLIMEQLKTGVVIIPAYFKAKLVNVPDNIEVIIEGRANENEIQQETDNHSV